MSAQEQYEQAYADREALRRSDARPGLVRSLPGDPIDCDRCACSDVRPNADGTKWWCMECGSVQAGVAR